MDSKTSDAKWSTSTKVIVPKIPQDIIDEILDHLVTNPDFSIRSLQSCSLASKSWVPSCRRHLFHTIFFTSRHMTRWLETFPVPEESPAHHVRDLRFSVGGPISVLERFFEHMPWFANVEGVALSRYNTFKPFWLPSFWRLPQSATSLTIRGDLIGVPQIQNIMAQLPNLNDLSLSGSLGLMDDRALVGIGKALRGKFGGLLRLEDGYVDGGVVDMLLEIPTRLHFTEMYIHGTNECLLSAVRLAEACAQTLVMLSYMVDSDDGCEAFVRSFDLSKFPNLQEVHLLVDWVGGDLLWIPTALSTLRPTTSPRLLAVRLSFICPLVTNRPEGTIEYTGNDLRQVVDEVIRIEREFEGAVQLTVNRDSAFETVLDKLNRYC